MLHPFGPLMGIDVVSRHAYEPPRFVNVPRNSSNVVGPAGDYGLDVKGGTYIVRSSGRVCIYRVLGTELRTNP